ncbi:MAG: IS3 family transposase [Acidobacteria bacterium]|nr:IS3 family transposase [Acidobacteriota bacterium]
MRRGCEELELARSTFYACQTRRKAPERVLLKRGPKTKLRDEQLTERIREILLASPFVGEGHRKVWACLRASDVRASRPRILRVMRLDGLLAPHRAKRTLGPRSHEGTIITEQPDTMWGTDVTTTMTVREGQAAVFIAVDQCTVEGNGIHAAKSATRIEPPELR